MTAPDAPRPRVHRLTVTFLVVAAALLAIALAVGTGDNPPGLAAAGAASIALVLAFVHRWRTPWAFARLAGVALVGGIACAILHNFPEVLGERMASTPAVGVPLQVVGLTLFLAAIFLAPAAFAVGVVGSVVTGVLRWREA